MSGKGNSAERVRAVALQITEELGLRLWDVKYLKEGANWFLRIFIDKESGILIEDCEAVSRAIDPLLDDIMPADMPYYLEVSSPGLGRELSKPEHFKEFEGEEVTVRLIRPLINPLIHLSEKTKEFIGKIKEYKDDVLTITVCHPDEESAAESKGEISFNKSEIAKVKLNDDKDLFDSI